MSERIQNQSPAPGGGGADRRQRVWKEKRRKHRRLLVTVVIRVLQVIGTFILIGALSGALFACYAAVYIQTSILPQAKVDFSVYTLNENSVIYRYDKETGEWVEHLTLVGSENREYVTYDQIPEDLINAIVAIEDKRFWDHQGVDWYRTAGAFVNMFLSMRNTFGASTLTQQTIKNYTEYDDVTVTRKILEIFTALQAEQDYDKEFLLERYLNKIYLGNGCSGVQAAAKYYFGKDVWDLSLAECASIAGITNNPSLYSPYGTVNVIRYRCLECGAYSNDPETACGSCGELRYGPGEEWTNREFNKARQETILYEMLNPEEEGTEPTLFDRLRTMIFGEDQEHHYITRQEYEQAVAEPLVFTRDSDYHASEDGESDGDGEGADSSASSVKYSWYDEAVIDEALKKLREATGMDEDYCKQLLYSGGLKIYCAFDPEVQAAVDQVYNDPTSLNIVSKTGQRLQSSITVVDNSTGYVVAMGTTFEKTGDRVWCYPVRTVRQPGSSIKPLAVYAPALEMGLVTPASVSDDNPHDIGSGSLPVNYDHVYRGLTTILDGVTRSVNTVSVNTLELVTPQASYEFLTERFGITSLVESKVTSTGKVLSDINIAPLSMGGLTYGVSTFEMAAAFAAFPRNGAYTPATTVLRIEDMNENVIVDSTHNTEIILKESTVYYMNTMLTNVVTSGTGTSARISGQTVAGKTGTATDRNDLWFCGYTSYYTAAVWTGYEYNEAITNMNYLSAQQWQKVMKIIHEGKENVPFPTPNNLRSYSICIDCGKLAVEDCRNDVRGSRTKTFQLVNGDGPTEYCTCHVAVLICKDSPIEGTNAYHLATEYCPAESVEKIIMVDYHRELADPSVKVTDSDYHTDIYEDLEEDERYCTVHDENWVDPNAPPGNDDPVEEPTGDPGAEVTPPPQETTSPVTPPPQETTPPVTPQPQETTPPVTPPPQESAPPVETSKPVEPTEDTAGVSE